MPSFSFSGSHLRYSIKDIPSYLSSCQIFIISVKKTTCSVPAHRCFLDGTYPMSTIAIPISPQFYVLVIIVFVSGFEHWGVQGGFCWLLEASVADSVVR